MSPKFVRPYIVKAVFDQTNTYIIERNGQKSVQNERRLKLHLPCKRQAGKAPLLLEPRRRLNMRGTTTKHSMRSKPTELTGPLPHPEGFMEGTDQPSAETKDLTIDASDHAPAVRKPTRTRRPPERYGISYYY